MISDMVAGKPVKKKMEEIIEEEPHFNENQEDLDVRLPGENESAELNYENDSFYNKKNSYQNEEGVILEDFTDIGVNNKVKLLKKANKNIYDDIVLEIDENADKTEKYDFILKQTEEFGKELLNAETVGFLPIEIFKTRNAQEVSYEEANLPFETIDVFY